MDQAIIVCPWKSEVCCHWMYGSIMVPLLDVRVSYHLQEKKTPINIDLTVGAEMQILGLKGGSDIKFLT